MRSKIPALFKKLWGAQTSSWRVLIPGILLTVILLLVPTGYEGALIYQCFGMRPEKGGDAEGWATLVAGLPA